MFFFSCPSLFPYAPRLSLQPLILVSVFTISLLNPADPSPFHLSLTLPRFRLPILCGLPSGLPTICYESSIFPWQNWGIQWLASLLSPALRTCAVKGIFVPQGPSSPREVCAVLFIQKKGFGLSGIFWGPMGKCELVWVVTPSLTSPKQHAASLEKGRNKPSTVDS